MSMNQLLTQAKAPVQTQLCGGCFFWEGGEGGGRASHPQ